MSAILDPDDMSLAVASLTAFATGDKTQFDTVLDDMMINRNAVSHLVAMSYSLLLRNAETQGIPASEMLKAIGRRVWTELPRAED